MLNAIHTNYIKLCIFILCAVSANPPWHAAMQEARGKGTVQGRSQGGASDSTLILDPKLVQRGSGHWW